MADLDARIKIAEADPGERARHGFLDPAVRDEFPGLGISYVLIERGSGRSPAHVKDHLRRLSDRFTGSQAIVMRQKPVPWSYRVFFRHIGLDPDRTRTPIEALALERMQRGRFRSQNLLDDALTIAIAETGVAVRAFDAAKLSGEVGIRASLPGEGLEGRPGELPEGTLTIADSERPLALLFGATGEGRGVHPRTRKTLLVAIQVKGVPEIAIEEALWLAATTMRSA